VEFQDVVRRRRMVRKFTSEPVPPESLDRILHNATRGPSAGFSQGQAFLVLEGPELAEFWAVGADWVHESARTAPLVIVPLSSKRVYLDRYAEDDKGWTDRAESHWPVPYWHIDTGMAALLILQTAVDEGLGAVFFGLDPDLVTAFREAFGVPEDHEPIGAIAIGHSAEPKPTFTSAITRRRKSQAEVVHRGRWGSPTTT
jgi:nitroreductase